MKTRRIGDAVVSAIGLGAMPMSSEFGKDKQASQATLHAALDAGVTLIDTADAYCTNSADFGDNERFVAAALAAYPGDTSSVLVATKGGHTRDEHGGWGLNGDPAYLKQACEASLKRLGVEAIGLYQFHRPDPRVPIGESVSALRDLLDAGKIRYAGVSNFNPAEIRQANEILGGRLVAVQNQFSPAFRSSEPELELCAELGIAFLPWSPLGGISAAADLGSGFTAFAEVAEGRGVSPQQVCLAWMLSKAEVVIPIPGASRIASVLDSVAAVHLELSADEIAHLDKA